MAANPNVGPQALRNSYFPVRPQPQQTQQIVGLTGSDGTSIVTNPGFENTGAILNGAMTYTTAQAHSGTYSVQAVGDGASIITGSPSGITGFAVQPGQVVNLQTWVYGKAANTGGTLANKILLGFSGYYNGKAVNNYGVNFSVGPSYTGAWTLLSATATIASGVNTIYPIVWFNSSGSPVGDTYYFDDPVAVLPGTQVSVGLSAGGVLDSARPAPTVIANPQVGPMALRQAYRRKPQAQAKVVGYTLGDAGSSVSVGLTAAGGEGDVVGDSGTSVAAGLTAAGSVGEATSAPDTVSVGLTAAGVVGYTLGDAGSSVSVGLTAAGGEGDVVGDSGTSVAAGLTAAGVSGGVTGGFLVETVGLIASDLLGVNSGATTTVSVGLTAAGSVGVVGAAATAAVVGLSAGGVEGENVGASQAVTVVLSAAGSVAFVGTASLRLTAGLAANGYVSMFGGATVTVQVASTVAGSIIAGYGGVEVIAPEVRTYMIPAEDRTCAIPAGDRTCVVV